MNLNLNKLLSSFLAEGNEDYIGLFQIVNRISTIIGIKNTTQLSHINSEKLLQATLSFIGVMLQNGFEIVTLEEKGECTAWPDQTIQNVSQKITAEWSHFEGNPGYIGFSFWFNKNTKIERSHY